MSFTSAGISNISANSGAWAVLLAAGSGSRLAAAANGVAKQFLLWKDRPLYWHSALALARAPVVVGIVFVFPPGNRAGEEERIAFLDKKENLGIPWIVTSGGATRQESARLGLSKVPVLCERILIHDAARPFLSPELICRVCAATNMKRPGVVPVIPATDTIKLLDCENGDQIGATLPRSRLGAAQTPQGFVAEILREAHNYALENDIQATDDASLLEQVGFATFAIQGETSNIKVTRPEDMIFFAEPERKSMRPCAGFGYDAHRFGAGRPLRLGGVLLPGNLELVAHSDGDVLLHALIDALLGCAGLGDIGELFPDDNPDLDGVSSSVLLDQTLELARGAGLEICSVDLTIVAQKPRLTPWRNDIRNNVARLLGLERKYVNVKATTEERMGFTGREEGIKAYATVAGLRP